jgi:hypothetical protein
VVTLCTVIFCLSLLEVEKVPILHGHNSCSVGSLFQLFFTVLYKRSAHQLDTFIKVSQRKNDSCSRG